MTEDRGAFKTIPRNSALSGHFVIGRHACGKNAALLQKNFSVGLRPSPGRHFVTNRSATLRYPRIGLIRRPAKRPLLWSAAFPWLEVPGKRGTRTMLPGFRFLFAAILLSTSVLIFGLGAAALLRAAHEEVASAPARRAPPEQVFAQQNEPCHRHWPCCPEPVARRMRRTPRTPAALRVNRSRRRSPPRMLPRLKRRPKRSGILRRQWSPKQLTALKPDEATPPERGEAGSVRRRPDACCPDANRSSRSPRPGRGNRTRRGGRDAAR